MDEEVLDPDDQAIKEARALAPMAISFLAKVMTDASVSIADRIQAARHILEVSGCLSL